MDISGLSRLDLNLWKEYLDIAQEFWLPQSLKSRTRFIVLLCLLMAFVASLLFLFVTVATTATHAFAPEFVTQNRTGPDGLDTGHYSLPADLDSGCRFCYPGPGLFPVLKKTERVLFALGHPWNSSFALIYGFRA